MNDRSGLDVLLRDPQPPEGGHLTRYRLEAPDDAALGHLSSCPVCRARREALEVERRSFLARAPASTLRLPERKRAMFLLPSAAAAAIAVIAAAIILQPNEERAKGGAELRVFVRRGDETRVARSGEGFQPGDALRLEITAALPAHVWVFLRSGGKLAAHYEDVELERSSEVLEGSLELDAESRAEELVVVVSERSLKYDAAARAVGSSRLVFDVTRKSGSGFGAPETHRE